MLDQVSLINIRPSAIISKNLGFISVGETDGVELKYFEEDFVA